MIDPKLMSRLNSSPPFDPRQLEQSFDLRQAQTRDLTTKTAIDPDRSKVPSREARDARSRALG